MKNIKLFLGCNTVPDKFYFFYYVVFDSYTIVKHYQ